MHKTPIDPDVIALFDELGPPSPVAASDLTGEELRQGMRDAIALFTRGAEPVPVHRITDEFVQGRGGKIHVRLYHPETPASVM
ncbi:hypothetical protein, partial [Streptomyces sp. NRRL S-15]